MDDETRYRKQAQVARDRAGTLSDPNAAAPWLRIAEEYDRLARKASREAERPTAAEERGRIGRARRGEVRDTVADVVLDCIRTRPYTTLAIADLAGFLLGALRRPLSAHAGVKRRNENK